MNINFEPSEQKQNGPNNAIIKFRLVIFTNKEILQNVLLITSEHIHEWKDLSDVRKRIPYNERSYCLIRMLCFLRWNYVTKC